jgi:hypothetical protein
VIDSKVRGRLDGPRFVAGWAGWIEHEKENSPIQEFSFGV